MEDSEDYKAFELSVTSDFDARTAVGRELVLRLASLLWRLRRATAIETGLLQIQSEILGETRRRGALKRSPIISFSMRSVGSRIDRLISCLTQNGTIVEQIATRHGSTTVQTI